LPNRYRLASLCRNLGFVPPSSIHLIFTNQIPLYLLQNIYIISEYIYAALFLLSLIYAAYRVFYKKEY
ncbi:MAG: hypothetical protein J6B00_01395, partial [Alphaproteobacteria bacterium]|nr:hypothetical protein [Alphaproteobacteria bacterium]